LLARQFGQLQALRPPHLLQLLPYLGWKLFVNRHQVIRFPSGLGEPALQELIERLQLLQPPVLAGPHFHTDTCPAPQTWYRARSHAVPPRPESRRSCSAPPGPDDDSAWAAWADT